jgi:hypothetical protein
MDSSQNISLCDSSFVNTYKGAPQEAKCVVKALQLATRIPESLGSITDSKNEGSISRLIKGQLSKRHKKVTQTIASMKSNLKSKKPDSDEMTSD